MESADLSLCQLGRTLNKGIMEPANTYVPGESWQTPAPLALTLVVVNLVPLIFLMLFDLLSLHWMLE